MAAGSSPARSVFFGISFFGGICGGGCTGRSADRVVPFYSSRRGARGRVFIFRVRDRN